MALGRHPMILGEARFDSAPFSNVWRMTSRGDRIATFTRFPSLHVTRGQVGESRAEIRPEGWGTVVYEEDEVELGRIVRKSWWGRRWEIAGTGFAAELVSEWRPRAWSLRLGVPGHQVGDSRLMGGRRPREPWLRRVL